MTRHENLLSRTSTALVIIDIQEDLARVMEERFQVIDSVTKLVKGFQILGLPMFPMEQYPKGLGRTVEQLRTLLEDYEIVEKKSFSVLRVHSILEGLKKSNVKQVVLVGMETHVCISQSALDLQNLGYQVHVVADGVCSRKESDHAFALTRMAHAGIALTTTEAVLFELLETSDAPEFKQISALVK